MISVNNSQEINILDTLQSNGQTVSLFDNQNINTIQQDQSQPYISHQKSITLDDYQQNTILKSNTSHHQKPLTILHQQNNYEQDIKDEQDINIKGEQDINIKGEQDINIKGEQDINISNLRNKSIIEKKVQFVDKRMSSIQEVGKLRRKIKLQCYMKYKRGQIEYKIRKVNNNYFSKVYLGKKHLFILNSGHGQQGHQIIKYISKNLIQILEGELKSRQRQSIDRNSMMYGRSSIVANYDHDKSIQEDQVVIGCINRANQKVDRKLLDSKIDHEYSGCTSIQILVDPKIKYNTGLDIISYGKLYVSNIGDNRAILVSAKDKCWDYIQLSNEHIPDRYDERIRITRTGGVVQKFRNVQGKFIGPYRVFMQGGEVLGLAVSRCFGNSAGKQVGVICDPEIQVHSISKYDKMVIVGSESFFQFVCNQEVVARMQNCQEQYEQVVNELVDLARSKWKNNEQDIQDIMLFIILLRH